MQEETVDETQVQPDDPKAGMNKEQLERIAHDGKGTHIHKMSDGLFTSVAIEVDSGGHVHTYKDSHGETRRTSISEDGEGHIHESEKGPTGPAE